MPDGATLDVSLHSEIEPGLWQGGCPLTTGAPILPDGVTRVLNLYGSRYALPEGVKALTQSFHDAERVPDLSILEYLAGLIDMWREEGRQVLVHCQAGLNRSGLVVALYLIRYRGMSAQEAISMQRARRNPLVLCNEAFERYLHTLTPTADTASAAPIGDTSVQSGSGDLS